MAADRGKTVFVQLMKPDYNLQKLIYLRVLYYNNQSDLHRLYKRCTQLSGLKGEAILHCL